MTLYANINTFTENLSKSVTGFKRIYNLSEIKAGVSKPDLPALLPMVRSGEYNRDAYGASDGAYGDSHMVIFRLLVAPEQQTAYGAALADMAQYVHAFRVAVVTLDSEQSSLSVEPIGYEGDVVTWYGESYFGCDFSVQFIV